MWVFDVCSVVIYPFFNLPTSNNSHFQNLEHGHNDAGEHVVPSEHLLGGVAQDALHRPGPRVHQGARHKRSCGGEGIASWFLSFLSHCYCAMHCCIAASTCGLYLNLLFNFLHIQFSFHVSVDFTSSSSCWCLIFVALTYLRRTRCTTSETVCGASGSLRTGSTLHREIGAGTFGCTSYSSWTSSARSRPTMLRYW